MRAGEREPRRFPMVERRADPRRCPRLGAVADVARIGEGAVRIPQRTLLSAGDAGRGEQQAAGHREDPAAFHHSPVAPRATTSSITGSDNIASWFKSIVPGESKFYALEMPSRYGTRPESKCVSWRVLDQERAGDLHEDCDDRS
jgi:hypothetical protein